MKRRNLQALALTVLLSLSPPHQAQQEVLSRPGEPWRQILGRQEEAILMEHFSTLEPLAVDLEMIGNTCGEVQALCQLSIPRRKRMIRYLWEKHPTTPSKVGQSANAPHFYSREFIFTPFHQTYWQNVGFNSIPNSGSDFHNSLTCDNFDWLPQDNEKGEVTLTAMTFQHEFRSRKLLANLDVAQYSMVVNTARLTGIPGEQAYRISSMETVGSFSSSLLVDILRTNTMEFIFKDTQAEDYSLCATEFSFQVVENSEDRDVRDTRSTRIRGTPPPFPEEGIRPVIVNIRGDPHQFFYRSLFEMCPNPEVF